MIVSPTLVKVGVAVLVGVALVGGITLVMSKIYGAGEQAGLTAGKLEMEQAVTASEKARNESLQRLIASESKVRMIEAEAAERIAAALARGRVQAKAVERAVRENPQFAAVVRPPELGGVRDEQLAELAAEADRSAELSAASLRGVRAPGTP